MTLEIPVEKLANNNPGYVQAIQNAAYAVSSHVDEIVDDVINGNTNRMHEFLSNSEKTEEELELQKNDEDLKLYFTLTNEIIPAISAEYGVDEISVTEDVGLVIECYTQKIIMDLMNKI